MGHSRKTDNYNLPLWDGGDKFTITGDLNHAHEIIDSTLKNNEDISTRASNLAADSSARVNDVSTSVDTRITAATESLNGTLSSALSTQNDTFNTTIAGLESSVDGKITGLETSVDGKIAGLETSVDGTVNSLRDDMAQAVASVPDKYLIDIVGDYGADPTGVTDTTPIFAQINADNPDGSCIFFRAGTYLFNDTIQIVGSTRLIGSGSVRASSAGEAEYEHGGTFLDFRAPVSRSQCITFDEWGTCNIEHLTIGTKGDTECAVFIKGNRKVLIIEDVSFCGPPNIRDEACKQDAIVFGTFGKIFGGYGTRINNVSFTRIRTCITMGPACNGVMVTNLVIAGTCGSSDSGGAPIVLDGAGDQCTANYIANVVCEVDSYPYLVAMGESKFNVLTNLQAWDTGVPDGPFDKAILIKGPQCINNSFKDIYIDILGFDRMSTDNMYLCGWNSYEGGGYQSVRTMTHAQLTDPTVKYPAGSFALNDTDGRLNFFDGANWQGVGGM